MISSVPVDELGRLLAIFELAEADVDEDVVFQASESIDNGLTTFDAFHAALAGEAILSSDQAYNTIPIERVPLEPEERTS